MLSFLPGGTELIEIKHPELGRWAAKVTATSVPDSVDQVAYLLHKVQNVGTAGPELQCHVPEGTHHLGDPLDIRASLLQLRGRASQWSAGRGHRRQFRRRANAPRPARRWLAPGPRSARRDLFRSARRAALLRSVRRFGLWGTRRRAGARDFVRTAVGHIDVSRSRTKLDGRIRDHLRDENKDGLNDALVIEVGVSVTDSGTYRMIGHLVDRAGKEQYENGERATLAPGDSVLELVYPTESLYEGGAPGPFVLDSLCLIEDDPMGYPQVDHWKGNYRTAAYPRLELMPAEVILKTKSFTARGIDRNGDGQFEGLQVDLQVDVRYAGEYYCHAVLSRGEGFDPWVSQGDERLIFGPGTNRVRFEFPAAGIRGAPAEGRFGLASLSVGRTTTPGFKGPPPGYGIDYSDVEYLDGPAPDRFNRSDATGGVSASGGHYNCESP